MGHLKLLYLILPLVGLTAFSAWPVRLLNLASFFLVVFAIIYESRRVARFTLVLTLIFLLFFAYQYGEPVRNELAADLGNEYTTDMRGFLKTYQLMKSGINFHQAFEIGITGSLEIFELDLAGWREPFLFHLWSLLPGNGISIYILWTTILLLVLAASYLTATKFLPEHYAVLSPFLLLPYLFYPLYDLALLQPEWWGVSFLILALPFYFYRHYFVAGVFFALSLASREMFFVPIFSLIIISFIKNGFRPTFKLVLPMIGFLIYYISYYLPPILSEDQGLIRPIRPGSPIFMNKTIAYSTWNYLLGPIRPIIWIGSLTTLILVFNSVKFVKSIFTNLELLALYLPTILALLIIGLVGRMTQWHDYWGVYFVPLLIIVTPIALATLWTTRSQE